MMVNATPNDIDTYWLSDTQFDTVEAYTSSADKIADNITVPAADDKYTGISIFYIKTQTNYEVWEGYKAQPWPDAGWTEMYRFEKGDSAIGSIRYYDDWSEDSTGADDHGWRWVYKTMTLESALIGLETVAATAFTFFATLMLM